MLDFLTAIIYNSIVIKRKKEVISMLDLEIYEEEFELIQAYLSSEWE
jgi:hypothetical protein